MDGWTGGLRDSSGAGAWKWAWAGWREGGEMGGRRWGGRRLLFPRLLPRRLCFCRVPSCPPSASPAGHHGAASAHPAPGHHSAPVTTPEGVILFPELCPDQLHPVPPCRPSPLAPPPPSPFPLLTCKTGQKRSELRHTFLQILSVVRVPAHLAPVLPPSRPSSRLLPLFFRQPPPFALAITISPPPCHSPPIRLVFSL